MGNDGVVDFKMKPSRTVGVDDKSTNTLGINKISTKAVGVGNKSTKAVGGGNINNKVVGVADIYIPAVDVGEKSTKAEDVGKISTNKGISTNVLGVDVKEDFISTKAMGVVDKSQTEKHPLPINPCHRRKEAWPSFA